MNINIESGSIKTTFERVPAGGVFCLADNIAALMIKVYDDGADRCFTLEKGAAAYVRGDVEVRYYPRATLELCGVIK